MAALRIVGVIVHHGGVEEIVVTLEFVDSFKECVLVGSGGTESLFFSREEFIAWLRRRVIVFVENVRVRFIEVDTVARVDSVVETAADLAFEVLYRFVSLVEEDFVLDFHELLEIDFVRADDVQELVSIYANDR